MNFTGYESCETLSGFRYIRKLEMQGNGIRNADFLTDFIHLEYLSLSINDITNIDFLKNMKDLKYLDLRRNRIQHFDKAYLSYPYNLKELGLDGNPIQNLPLEIISTEYSCLNGLREYFNLVPASGSVPVNSHLNTPATPAAAEPVTGKPAPKDPGSWWPFIVILTIYTCVGGILSAFKPLGFLLGAIACPLTLFIFIHPSGRKRRRW